MLFLDPNHQARMRKCKQCSTLTTRCAHCDAACHIINHVSLSTASDRLFHNYWVTRQQYHMTSQQGVTPYITITFPEKEALLNKKSLIISKALGLFNGSLDSSKINSWHTVEIALCQKWELDAEIYANE